MVETNNLRVASGFLAMAEPMQLDEDAQSRQIAVYGREALLTLGTAKVLISGVNGLGVEIGAALSFLLRRLPRWRLGAAAAWARRWAAQPGSPSQPRVVLDLVPVLASPPRLLGGRAAGWVALPVSLSSIAPILMRCVARRCPQPRTCRWRASARSRCTTRSRPRRWTSARRCAGPPAHWHSRWLAPLCAPAAAPLSSIPSIAIG